MDSNLVFSYKKTTFNLRVTGDIPDFSNQTEAEAFQLFLGQYFGQVMQLAAEDKPVTLIPEYVTVCGVKE